MLIRKKRISLLLVALLSICLNSQLIFATGSESSKNLEVVVLEQGTYDSAYVLDAIEEYCISVRSALGFDCSVVKLPPESNNPQGINEFIEGRSLTGVQLFILVGNDLKWPLRTGSIDNVPAAAPDDGVLCDTDGELSVGQPIATFTAEVAVSYIFPPKSGINEATQTNWVVKAFKKFSKYHQGKLTYEKKAVICGRPETPGIENGAIDRMASASELIFGNENVTKKELSSSEVETYLEQAPAFFGVAGHGSPQVVETSASGGLLSYADLTLSGKAPMLLEISGCWTSGWQIRNENDPWYASRGFLSEAGIFENIFNIAMVSGNPGPESKSEHSFSNLVLSQIPSYPEATIGELMIGKERRSTDWTLFGDPTLRLDVTGGVHLNEPPIAYIDSITPNPAEEGTNVYFEGHATDSDGEIVGYRWWSSLDRELSRSASFSTQSLSVGTHNIHFKAQDDYGAWSEEVIRQVAITSTSDVNILSPVDGERVAGKIVIFVSTTVSNVIAVNFYIDGTYKGYDKTAPYEYDWNTMLYSNGQHKIQAKAYSDRPVMTYSSKTITVAVNNSLPTVTIISPSDGSTVIGTRSIDIVAEDSDMISRVRFYIDGIAKGYDYRSPFQWSWDTTSYANGPHVVHVDAFYTNLYRYVSSERITVFVNNTQIQRTVAITSPSDREEVSGTIIVNVEATEDDLLRVYIYADGKWMGYGGASPCQFSLNTASLSNGSHEIYAVALYGARPPHTEIKSNTIIVIVNNSI